MAYRTTRNIEASIITYLNSIIDTDWSNINVVKGFKQVYNLVMTETKKNAIICVRSGVTTHDRVEIGSSSTKRQIHILIDLFCTSDGQRLDLKDWVIEKIKGGCTYYEFTIENGGISRQTDSGNITILDIDDVPIDFDVDKDKLDVHDRYRHLITLNCSIGQVEA